MKNNSDIKKRNFLTQNEIESLLNAANSGPHAARNYCLTLLCFIHGFRASEICRLRISDIDLRSKCIYIHRLKKGFSTTHPLLNKEVQALKRWLDIRDEYPQSTSEWLFLSRKGNPLSRRSFTRSFPPLAIRQDYRWKFIRTCCATPAVLRWPIWASIRDLSRIIWATATFAIPSGTRPVTPGAFMASGISPARSREPRFSSKVTLRHGWRFVIGSSHFPFETLQTLPTACLLQICSV